MSSYNEKPIYYLPPNLFDKEDSKVDKDYITSYGTVTYYHNKVTNKLYYLSCEIRDTIPYREFIRGALKESEIPKYISLMSMDEILRLKKYYNDPHKVYPNNYDYDYFNDIWNDLWVKQTTKTCTNKYEEAKEKFHYNMKKFQSCFNEYNTNKKARVFCKGRLQSFKNESKQVCAIRETCEEANIKQHLLKIEDGIEPEYETYIGNDGKKYQTVYYLCRIQHMPVKKYIRCESKLRSKYISSEMSEIYWEDFETLYSKLDPAKKKILQEFDKQLRKMYSTDVKPLSICTLKRPWSV